MSTVDVVIPCYTSGHVLDEAVRGVLDYQPGVDVRILVIATYNEALLLEWANGRYHGRVAETPVDALVAFAPDCWPVARRLAVFRTLEWRRILGLRAMSRLARSLIPERGARSLAESGDRYANAWEAVATVARPGGQPVRFA